MQTKEDNNNWSTCVASATAFLTSSQIFANICLEMKILCYLRVANIFKKVQFFPFKFERHYFTEKVFLSLKDCTVL
jgi:hypothetical protein